MVIALKVKAPSNDDMRVIWSVPDPWHFVTDSDLWIKDPDLDPDPDVFFSGFPDAKQKEVFLRRFFYEHFLQSFSFLA